MRQSPNSFLMDPSRLNPLKLVNLGHNASIIVLAHCGIGSHDDIITVGMMYKMGLWTIIWQFLYVLDGALIKSSIIWTMLRLAKDTKKIYRQILWALFALAWIVWQISWPMAIFQCKPVSAAWGEPGDCTSGQQVILNGSYFVSSANIFTDISTALVPAFLLRHIQIPKKAKIATVGILSLGVFAGVATAIRIGYTWAYTTPVDKYCKSHHFVPFIVCPAIALQEGFAFPSRTNGSPPPPQQTPSPKSSS